MFVEDAVLFPAVQKIVRQTAENNKGSLFNRLMDAGQQVSNEDIGALLRANSEGSRLVETIFADLARYRKEVLKEEKPMPGR